jgi:hypothetical protein
MKLGYNVYITPVLKCVFLIICFAVYTYVQNNYTYKYMQKTMRWVGHVARMGRRMHVGYWWEIQKERDHWEDQDVGGWTILKWVVER